MRINWWRSAPAAWAATNNLLIKQNKKRSKSSFLSGQSDWIEILFGPQSSLFYKK